MVFFISKKIIFRKLADLKREQELADRSKNDPNDAIEIASSNSAIRKLFSKFRKRSIDSGGSHSIENVGLNQMSASAASTPSVSLSNALFGMKGGDTSSNNIKSHSGSAAALTSSVSGGRLITINEKPFQSKKANNALTNKKVGYPTLPPLSEAESVKQKWSILLSKAKGGVEHLPKAFLNGHEFNKSISLSLDSYKELNVDNQLKNPEVFPNISEDEDESPETKPLMAKSPSIMLNPIIVKSASNNEAVKSPSHVLDETRGFFLDHEFIELENAANKSLRNDDGLNRNPVLFLNSLINYRSNLRNEIENSNSKISQVDKKITEILQLVSGASQNNKGDEFSTPQVNKNFLGIHSSLRDESFLFNSHHNLTSSHHSHLREQQQQPQLHSPCLSAIGSHVNLRPPHLIAENKNTGMDSTNKSHMQLKSDLHVSRNTLIAMSDYNGSNVNLIEPSITINEIRLSPSIYNTRKTNKKESHHKSSLRKDALGGSSTIAAAVSGASSLLSAVINNKPNPISCSNKSHLSISSSNYNINLIQCETDKKVMTTSASDNLIKENAFRKLVDKKPRDKRDNCDEQDEIRLKLLKKP